MPELIGSLKLKPNDLLYDIGCGDARLLIHAVRTYGCKAVGIEIDPAIAEKARRNVAAAWCANDIRIVCGDARKYRYNAPTAVVMYTTPRLLRQVAWKIKTDRIASWLHGIPGRPTTVVDTQLGPIYVSQPLVTNSKYAGWRVLNR